MTNTEKKIGRVIATEKSPTTSTTLKFWVEGNTRVRPFDVVRIEHMGPEDNSTSLSYAMITELEFITDGAGFLAGYVSSDFGDVDAIPRSERIGTTIAYAEVLFNDNGIEMPIQDGQSVYWADEEGVKEALGLKDFKNPVPAGYMTMSNGNEIAVQFEGDFLVGPEGAHLNIAGISGLATKTSYAMFLMNALQQTSHNPMSYVIFNVKGHDLLSINEERPDLSDKIKVDWQKCGLVPRPFENVKYFYPYSKNQQKMHTQSRVPSEFLSQQIEREEAYNYFYNVEYGIEKLPLLFSDIDDPLSTIESCILSCRDFDLSNWAGLIQSVKAKTQAGKNQNKEIPVQSWRKFYRLLNTRISNDIFEERSQTKRELKRQVSTFDILGQITAGQVCVIDIEPLPDYLQCLVVGDLIGQILSAKLGEFEEINPEDMGRVVIFADELNKYAPKTSRGIQTLTNTLLEVTERGRSLGVVLFGAEQFRSGVHDRVLGNCSTSAFGRTNPIETQKGAEYKLLSKPQVSSLVRLPKGTLMLQHPVFTAAVIKAQFPEPVYVQPKG